VVEQSLKKIILSGKSALDKYIDNRFLYFIGFISGWNPKIFSLEFIPLGYFVIWAIVMLILREYQFAFLFLGAFFVILTYFVILHAIISAWDKIKRWLIRRAQKRGGIANLTLADVKFLLIYTRKVFGVRATVPSLPKIDYDPNKLRKFLLANKRWRFVLNLTIIADLFIVTGGGIFLFIYEMDLLDWLINNWFYLFTLLIPIAIVIIGLAITRDKIRSLINSIPIEKFDEVLYILNEFKIYGGNSIK
jgi:hypothetical protein